MATDDSAHVAKLREMDEQPPAVAAKAGGRTSIVLGGLAGLLLAGAVYYVAGSGAGPEVATAPGTPSSETIAATQPPPAGSADKPVAATTPQPAAPQSPSPVAAAEATPKAPPATAAPASVATPATASGSQSAASSQAPAAPQSMRDQPAALPDQAAAAPKPTNEIMLVVKRGPAKMRSTPGKGGRLIGSVAKDTRLKEISRSGKWVEVETASGRGWINALLLAPLSSGR